MPSMIGGIGTSFIGERDKRPDGSYVTTEFFVVGIPLFPLRSFRVRPLGDMKVFLNTTSQDFEVTPVPLNWRQVINVYAGCAIAIGILLGVIWYFNRGPTFP